MVKYRVKKGGLRKKCGYAATAAALAVMIATGACAGAEGASGGTIRRAENPVYTEANPVSGEGGGAETDTGAIEFCADGSDVTLLIRHPPVFDNIFFDNPDFVNGTTERDDLYISGFYKVVQKTADEYFGESLATDWMVEHEDYTNVGATEIKTVDAGGMKVRYARVQFDYRDITTYVYYSCAEAGGELVTVTMDCTVAKGVSDPVGEDGVCGVWDNISVQ